MEDSTYVRVNRARVKSGRWDEFEAAYAGIVPLVGKAEGLRGRWLVRSMEDTDDCYVVSMWASEEAMSLFEGDLGIHEAMLAAMMPFLEEPFTADHGKVQYFDS
jgi:hypothetical protein